MDARHFALSGSSRGRHDTSERAVVAGYFQTMTGRERVELRLGRRVSEKEWQVIGAIGGHQAFA